MKLLDLSRQMLGDSNPVLPGAGFRAVGRAFGIKMGWTSRRSEVHPRELRPAGLDQGLGVGGMTAAGGGGVGGVITPGAGAGAGPGAGTGASSTTFPGAAGGMGVAPGGRA